MFYVLVTGLVLPFLSHRLFPSEETIRYCSLALQVAGSLVVIWDIETRRRYFGLDGLPAAVRTWIGDFPRLRPKPTRIPIELKIAGSEIVEISLWYPDNRDAPLEDRISGLVRNLDDLRSTVEALESKVKGSNANLEKQLRQQSVESERKIAETEKKIIESQTSGRYPMLVGVLWVIMGTVTGALAPEITRWLEPSVPSVPAP